MSDAVKAAEANVNRFRRALTAHLDATIPNAGAVVANIEGLILAHIQKMAAHMVRGTQP